MKRGKAARDLIEQGEDPFQMLLAVVWPGHDCFESVPFVRLTSCPECSDCSTCTECGNTGLVTIGRHQVLTIEALASATYEAA